MKSEKKLLFIILSAFFLISGCQDDKGKNDYSGVSDLISERNAARHEIAGNAPKKSVRSKNIEKKVTELQPDSDEHQKELMSIILYEEKVKIVGSDSGRTLANGVAYVNKKGQIVRIKITKE